MSRRFGDFGIRRGLRKTGPVDGSASWSPASLSPEGWWRPDLGLSEVSLEVTDLENQGTEGDLDLSQATASRRPNYIASRASFNDQPVLEFDGGDVLASVATSAWEMSDGEDLTVVIVFEMTATALDVSVATDDSTNGGWSLQPRSGGASRFRVWDGTAALTRNGPSLTTGTVYVQAGVITGAVSPAQDLVDIWTDGVISTSGSGLVDLGAIGQSGTEEFLLGANSVTGGTGLNGYIAEALFLKRLLTSDEDDELTSYFNARYGLSLPGVVT